MCFMRSCTNKHVVDDFRTRGVTFVEDISEVPPGGRRGLQRARHLARCPSQSRNATLVEVDATCPLSPRFIWKCCDSPATATTSSSSGIASMMKPSVPSAKPPEHISVVESPEEAQTVRVPDPAKVAYVTQTTLSIFDANRIIAALKQRFPNIRSAPKEDICYATTNRQNAVSQLSREADLVLVIGSKKQLKFAAPRRNREGTGEARVFD